MKGKEMNIDELKKIIKNDLRKIGVCLRKEEKNKRIHFGDNVDGDYNIYIDGKIFNLVKMLDRGETKKYLQKIIKMFYMNYMMIIFSV